MRIKPGPDDKPATGFSWGDYEDVDTTRVIHEDNDADGSEDDGWGVVKSKRSSECFDFLLIHLFRSPFLA
jgi:hypothetical protein